ncbi:hypothetical protein WMY93_033491 [Mugilogobius chulae]|uniref:SPIN-DOC-like zinc-finger domain-containing protein n=1 Tax=Mugilogobius chulae TaxID=88201 RepID=A0AAW0MKM0_9GOBI
MSLSKAKRKADGENRQFQDRWTSSYFFVDYNGLPTCLICKERVAVPKDFNLKRHFETKHGEQYGKYEGPDRARVILQLKKELASQQSFFHQVRKDADAALEASYVVSELIAKAGKPFTEGEFLKDCMLRVADLICPEKRHLFTNISLSANTVAERINELSNDIYGQLRNKARDFTAYSVALDESTDKTDHAQLAIFIRGINNQFEVTGELLSMCPMHGRTTAKDLFEELSGSLERAGLPWDKLTGITTDGAPSMAGKKNGLVALEIEAAYGDVLSFTEVRWLSRGQVLKRFFELREEIKMFLDNGKMTVTEFDDPKLRILW